MSNITQVKLFDYVIDSLARLYGCSSNGNAAPLLVSNRRLLLRLWPLHLMPVESAELRHCSGGVCSDSNFAAAVWDAAGTIVAAGVSEIKLFLLQL